MGWKKGSVVMEAKPYAHVICQKFNEERCNYCLKSSDKLKKCGACKNMWYCGTACQRGDWRIHKTECQIMKRVPNLPTDSIRLYLRLVILDLARASSLKATQSESPCIRSFSDLMSHSDNIKTEKTRAQLFQLATDFLRAYTHGVLQLPDDDLLLDIFGKMVINTFTIADEMLQDVGVAVYSSPSVLDHRCWPNAVASFDGQKVIVRAVEDIPSGSLSDVYLSYIDPMASRSERQQQLQEQYYFTCDCERCNNAKLEAMMTSEQGSNEDDLKKVKTCLETVEEMRKNQSKFTADTSEVLAVCEACLDQVKLPQFNVHQARLRGKAFDLAIEAQQWEKALAHGTTNLKPSRTLNPPFTPAVGYLYANSGKLSMFLGKLHEAKLYLSEAIENFLVALGQGHILYSQVRGMLEQCEAELAMAEADVS